MTQPVETNKSDYPCTWRLVFSVVAACFGSAALGADIAYSSPAIVDVNDAPNSFRLNFFQASIASGAIGLGSCIGAPLCGIASDIFGRRHMLIVITLPITLAWLVVTSSNTPEQFVVGRFFTGFFAGFVENLPPVYISEISPPHLRGRLVSLTGVFKTMGFTYVFGLGEIVRWNWLAVFCSAFSVALAMCLVFMCESPCWLLKQRRSEEAKMSLTRLRGESVDVSREISEIERCIQESEVAQMKFSFRIFIDKPQFYNPLLSVIVLMIVMQLVGGTSMTVHSVEIFLDISPDLDPLVQSVIISISALVGGIVCVLVVDRIGRKYLLICSYVIVIVSFGILGLFLVYQNYFSRFSFHRYVPLVCLATFHFSARLGIVIVPQVLLGEMFPLQFRGLASGICGSVVWFFAFLTSWAFPYAAFLLHYDVFFWSMGAVALFSSIYTFLVIPETKGKTLEEIELSYAVKKKPCDEP